MICNAARRSWWQWRKLPLILGHVGFLLILAGGFFTWQIGLRGSLPINENETRDTFLMTTPVLEATHGPAGTPAYFTSHHPLDEAGKIRCRTAFQALNPFHSSRALTLQNGESVTLLDRIASSRATTDLEANAAGPPGIVLTVDHANHQHKLALQAGESKPMAGDRSTRVKYLHLAEGGDPQPTIDALFVEYIEIRPPRENP